MQTNSVTILFGSQTGTGEGIAKRVTLEAKEKGLEAKCFSMDEFEKVGDIFSPSILLFSNIFFFHSRQISLEKVFL